MMIQDRVEFNENTWEKEKALDNFKMKLTTLLSIREVHAARLIRSTSSIND